MAKLPTTPITVRPLHSQLTPRQLAAWPNTSLAA